VSARGYSQITLSETNAPLQKVFHKIQQQSGYDFVCTYETLKQAGNVTVKVSDVSLQSALKECLKEKALTYVIIGKTVIVKPGQQTYHRINTIPTTDPITPPPVEIHGRVVNQQGEPLQNVSVMISGTTVGTTTNSDGRFLLNAPDDKNIILEISSVGFQMKTVNVGKQTEINVVLELEVAGLSDVVVVGYGTQKKSDITGSVASLSKDKLEMVPNLNLAQAIQGAIPGVLVKTASAGASSDESIMIRGRNSIAASNSPLIVLDGIPYGGNLGDINVNDIQSIEILKDASAAAIYGSRSSSGVILVTTKNGVEGKTRISYEGKYSVQTFAHLPNLLNGFEYYDFKNTRFPGIMTQSEKEVYDKKEWTNWMDLAFRKGLTQQHDISVTGGAPKIKYFLSANYLDVQGLAINDDYRRLSARMNLDAKIASWIDVGTRTQFSYDDLSGEAPDMSEVFAFNPLTTAFDEHGGLLIHPWSDDPSFGNPLQPTLYKNKDIAYQINSNNFLLFRIPFVPGLSYKFNSGIRVRVADNATYRGRDTQEGLDVQGSANTDRAMINNTVIENILTYSKVIGDHKIDATALYSFEENKATVNSLSASRFPNDFLTYYSIAQAALIEPSYNFDQTKLVSQMLRLNYGYKNRYLATITTRRDGFSGFGTNTKWGVFPSAAIGWNIDREDFFPWKETFNVLKLRLSWGENGKQASGAYSSISRLSEFNIVDRKATAPGYIPSVLGQENLGWESSRTINLGIDYGLFNNRITGDINLYKTNTSDLLLNRSISSVQGISSIIQNIGETQNKGIEFSINSNNIAKGNFKWTTNANFSYIKNEIVSLGQYDQTGKPIDDVANSWFIGKPINVNYDFVWAGTWQLDETAEATKWNTKPGFVKLKDRDGDYQLTGADREIIGQQDPKWIWGLTNSFSYKNFKLNVFIYGIEGVTKNNSYMSDYVYADVRRNTVKKNWWTTTNPTNDWIINDLNADRMDGLLDGYYQNASFVRIKDITLSYDLPSKFLDRIKIERLRLYVTGRNQFTFTKWTGLDPELSDQEAIPLQKEVLFGLSLGF
jgi:TonB-linked SusC/RagA family outer membrane protein